MDSGSIISAFEHFMKNVSPEARQKLLEGVDSDTLNDNRRERLIKKGKIEIGRNDSCPCGSSKKFKKCCLNKKTLKPSEVLSNV